ncbi:MAG: glycosyltransferase family 39 protein [Pirellulaceae bacterium]
MCIPFSLLGGLVCYRWASELYGARSGLMALCLWCFSPNILGHAQLITPDVGATALGVTAFYAFWHWLREYNWSATYIAGVVVGLAQLSKGTSIILFALLPLIWLLGQKPSDIWRTPREVLRRASQLASILLLAIVVLNVGYGLEGSFQPLRDYEFVSSTLSGSPKEMAGSDVAGNRFRDTLRGQVAVPLPRNFVLGIDLQKRGFETNIPSYLRGEVRRGGWWYYYLYALLVKVPVGTWILVAAACFLTRRARQPRAFRIGDEWLLVIPIVMVLVLASNQTGINKHMRYVLTIFPFAFILISRVADSVDWRRRQLASTTIVVALAASIASSLLAYPHSLAYFNEISGGPRNGSFHLLSSNIAWGQDMLYLKRWLDSHPEVRPLHLAAHCGFDPRIAGVEFSIPPKQPIDEHGNIAADVSFQPPPGWYAVDANMLRGYPYIIPDGAGGRTEAHRPYFTYFQKMQPVARIGYSLFIYRVNGSTSQNISSANRFDLET